MQIERRAALGGAAAMMLTFMPRAARSAVDQAFAPLIKRALLLHWHGQSHQKTSFTSTGDFVTDIEADFQIDENWNLLGKWKEAFLFEGKLFVGHSRFRGVAGPMHNQQGSKLRKAGSKLPRCCPATCAGKPSRENWNSSAILTVPAISR